MKMRANFFRRPFSAIARRGAAELPTVVSTLTFTLTLILTPTSRTRADLPKVPAGFEARLVATVPAVTYPSQVATAPDGSLFVAEDPMDQVGPYEADHGRILQFKPGKDEPTVFAEGFRAIFGMAWYEGSLYVMNMPRLTVLKDENGDGKADESKELFKDLGPGPKVGALNDHIVSGLQFGMDGYLYISVGDKGIPKAHGPDGKTVTLRGGGIVRCRPDGTGLELFSTGTRNHLEPNLDAEDNLFTYDNTDDGLGWWTRVTHQIDGGYYGYPWDYHRRTDRMLNRIEEYGGGSPCGGLVYKEDVWPEKYRGRAYWAEWGKRHVAAIAFEPAGASFKIVDYLNFVEPTDDRLRPIDLALSYDGRTLYVADWSMGGWGNKNEKLGRIFAISYRGEVKTRPRGDDSQPIAAQIAELDHPSFNERLRAQRVLIKKGKEALPAAVAALASSKTDPLAKRHLIWAIDGIAGGTDAASRPIMNQLKSRDADLRAQAARALGEREVKSAVGGLSALADDREPSVRLQAIIALGRIRDARGVNAILPRLIDLDPYVAFSARVALRRIGDWKAASRGLASRNSKIRDRLLAAMEEVYDADAVAALARFAADPKLPQVERAKAIFYLASNHKKAPEWNGEWWGTQPYRNVPEPVKTIIWKGTPIVHQALRKSLRDPSAEVRTATIKAIAEIEDREALITLRKRLSEETDPGARRELIVALGKFKDQGSLPLLTAALRESKTDATLRDAALKAVAAIGGDAAIRALVELLSRSDLPADRQVQVAAALGAAKAKPALPILSRKLADRAASVRAAAAEAIGEIGLAKGIDRRLVGLLGDKDLAARKAAIKALGELKVRGAIPALIESADDESTRFEATLALTKIPDVQALQIYLRGLADKNNDLRVASSNALTAVRDEAAPVLDRLAGRKELSPRVLAALRPIYSSLRPIATWQLIGPFPKNAPPPFATNGSIDFTARLEGLAGKEVSWREIRNDRTDGMVDLAELFPGGANCAVFGYAEVRSPTARTAQLSLGSDDTLTVWINGKQVFDFQGDRGFTPDQDKADVPFEAGTNRIVIRCGNSSGPWKFSVRASSPLEHAFLKENLADSSAFDPDAYRDYALKTPGDAKRGETLFRDPKGLACVKCHAVGGQGGLVGPDLSSVGVKYPKGEIVTAVLNPSAKIALGYEPTTIATANGQVLNGIVKNETKDFVEIEDADAKRFKLSKADIDERKPSTVSIMPIGLAEGLSKQDFADLIAYLESLKQGTNPKKK